MDWRDVKDMCLFVATGSPSLNPQASPWLPRSSKDDRSEEGCYQPDIPVRYYTQEQVDDLLMKKEEDTVISQDGKAEQAASNTFRETIKQTTTSSQSS